MVLSFILIQNRQGKTRLAKYYNAYSDDEKIKLKGEVSSPFPTTNQWATSMLYQHYDL